MTYMFILKCALKLVLKKILYYDARSEKHQIRYTNFTNLFWHATLHVSDSSSVLHQEFIHCTLSNGICHTGL